MNQNQPPRISEQINKVQTDRKLIAVYDRLRYAPLTSYAQMHAKGEYQENGHNVNSLIGITIQDYSNGTGNKNIIVQFNLAPEQIQFFLTRITAGFQEYEWSLSKIYGNPDAQGYSIAQQFSISRHVSDQNGRIMKSPWRIQIVNGKSEWRILYEIREFYFRKERLYPANGYGPVYVTKTHGFLHYQLGILYGTFPYFKWEACLCRTTVSKNPTKRTISKPGTGIALCRIKFMERKRQFAASFLLERKVNI